QPGAPAPLDPHSRVNLRDTERHTRECQRKEHGGEPEYSRGIAFLDGIKDIAIPDIDPVFPDDVKDDQHQKPDGADPADSVPAVSPEAGGRTPEPLQQSALARLLRLFWRHGLVRLSDLRWRRFDLCRLRDIRHGTLGRFVTRFFGIFA